MNVTKNIRAYLKKTGRTQAFLCKHTGLSATALSLALGGKRRLQIEEYRKICKALGLSSDYFL